MPIIGLPNVGKSSLLNSLMGYKVSIVTHKPHTTRSIFASKKTINDIELVLVDTPGIDKVKNKLGTVIFDGMQQYLSSLDSMILVLDVTNPNIYKFADYVCKSIVVLNKIDRVKKHKLLPIIQQLQSLNAKEVFCVCSKTGDGIQELLDYLKKQSLLVEEKIMPESVDDVKSALDFVCESVREKILLSFEEEIPYKVMIEVVDYRVPLNSAWKIDLNIVVPKESYKPIIIGKKCARLKDIGRAARIELSLRLKQPGFLKLNVVVDEEMWKRKETYHALGWDA